MKGPKKKDSSGYGSMDSILMGLDWWTCLQISK